MNWNEAKNSEIIRHIRGEHNKYLQEVIFNGYHIYEEPYSASYFYKGDRIKKLSYTKIKLNYNGSTYQNELSCDLSKFYIGYPIQINDYENLFGRGNTLDNIPIKKGYPDIYFIYSNKVDGINIVYRQLFESDFIKKDVGEFLSFYKILNYSNSLSNDYFKYYVNGNSIKLQINKIPKKLINFK